MARPFIDRILSAVVRPIFCASLPSIMRRNRRSFSWFAGSDLPARRGIRCAAVPRRQRWDRHDERDNKDCNAKLRGARRLGRCFWRPAKNLWGRPNVCARGPRRKSVARAARQAGAPAILLCCPLLHSARSAMTGSTRAARRAGNQHARTTASSKDRGRAESQAIKFGAGISAH